MNKNSYGIDISEYQGDFDIAGSGAEFVIIRIGDGTWLDRQLENNIIKAEKAKIPYGFYYLLRDTQPTSAAYCAEYVLQVIKDLGARPSMGIWCDVEDSSFWNGSDPAQPAAAFCRIIESAGYYAGIYCNWDFYNRLYPYCRDFDCWIADYNGILADPPGTMQQYSTSDGTLDKDISFAPLEIYNLKPTPEEDTRLHQIRQYLSEMKEIITKMEDIIK